MRFNRKLLSLVAVAHLSLPATAPAAVIFTTGEGPAVTGGLIMDGTHWRALAFTLSSPHTISDVEAWMYVPAPGTYTVALYSDSGFGTPGTSLFSTVTSTGQNLGWTGIHGIAVTLAAGSYWAGFESRTGQTLSAAMPSGAPTAIPSAFGFGNGPYCCTEFALRMGLRIQGEAVSVPEPGTLVLICLGIAALVVPRLRRAVQRT